MKNAESDAEVKGCRLCLKDLPLLQSHIIPSAVIVQTKRIDERRTASQLVVTKTDPDSRPTLENFDPKEPLCCQACETLLRSQYEDYGTKILNPERAVIHHRTAVIMEGLDYPTFYLYLLSILWRASVSSLPDFQNIKIRPSLEEMMRRVIYHKTLHCNLEYRIDDVVKIFVFKVIDKREKLKQKHIDKALFLPGTELKEGTTLHYFMSGGYLICYLILPADLGKTLPVLKNDGQLGPGRWYKFPKVDIANFGQIANGFQVTFDKKVRFNLNFK